MVEIDSRSNILAKFGDPFILKVINRAGIFTEKSTAIFQLRCSDAKNAPILLKKVIELLPGEASFNLEFSIKDFDLLVSDYEYLYEVEVLNMSGDSWPVEFGTVEESYIPPAKMKFYKEGR